MKALPSSFFVFSPLCLLMAFSLNIIVVFLSCPGSHYCLTKYFMARSTPYLPTASHLLSKNKGLMLWRGRKEERRSIPLFLFSTFSSAPNAWEHWQPGRGVFYLPGSRPATYLFICSLFMCCAFFSMILSTCFLAVSLPICSEGTSSKRLWQPRERLTEY